MSITFVFAIGLVSGVITLIYLYPEVSSKIHGSLSPNASPYDVVLHISTEEEIEVIKAVKKMSFKAYKFEIAKKTRLSRMKIHRITTRLSERGIFIIEKNGRFSKILLADWMQ